MWIFYVDILCGYFMLIFYVYILCGYFMWIFYVDILCGYFMRIFYVDILCGNFMWIFYVDILCGYVMCSTHVFTKAYTQLHFLVVPSQYVILLTRRYFECLNGQYNIVRIRTVSCAIKIHV